MPCPLWAWVLCPGPPPPSVYLPSPGKMPRPAHLLAPGTWHSPLICTQSPGCPFQFPGPLHSRHSPGHSPSPDCRDPEDPLGPVREGPHIQNPSPSGPIPQARGNPTPPRPAQRLEAHPGGGEGDWDFRLKRTQSRGHGKWSGWVTDLQNRLEKFQTHGPLGENLIVLPLKRSKDGLPKFGPDALHGWKPCPESSSGQNPGLWAHPPPSSHPAPPSWAQHPRPACVGCVCAGAPRPGLWVRTGADGAQLTPSQGANGRKWRGPLATNTHRRSLTHRHVQHACVHLHVCACVHVCAHIMHMPCTRAWATGAAATAGGLGPGPHSHPFSGPGGARLSPGAMP